MLRNPVIMLFAGLLGIFSLWFGFASDSNAFVATLLPELIGFCLEGMFFIGIFTWLQERRDRARKQELRQSLAGALGFLCQVINSSFDEHDQVSLPAKDNWTRQARNNGHCLNELLARLSNCELQVNPEQLQAMQRLLRTRLSTLDSLLSVSAQLSHSHLSAFALIVTEVHKLAEHTYIETPDLKKSFVSVLRLLISFNGEAL